MNKEIEAMQKDLIEIFDEEYEKRRLITPQNTAEKMSAKGYRKHRVGYWFFVEHEFFNCSECGEGYYNGSDSTAQTKEMLESGRFYPYCPNCGAKMEGEENGGYNV